MTDRTHDDGPIVQSVEYVYDSQNRWIAKSVDPDGPGPQPSTDTHFVYDGNQIILQLDEAGAVTNRYLWGPAVDQIFADEQVQPDGSSEILWPLTDHLNTVRDLAVYDADTNVTTIANHIVYDAYGRVTSQTAPTVTTLFGFTARPFDPSTGLQNNLNRWYDAEVGRWLSEDPTGFQAGDANLYPYVGNRPTNSTDPTGCLTPDAQKLFDRYNELWGSKNIPDDRKVGLLIMEALVIADGDAEAAFGLIYEARNAMNGLDDVWASADHFFQSWVLRNQIPNRFLASMGAHFANQGYTYLKFLGVRVGRDTPGIPPSRPTMLQLYWGEVGGTAAFRYDTNLWDLSWEARQEFISWVLGKGRNPFR